MATMITEVYDAFLAGGAPEAKAREAAEALSSESLSTKGDIVKTEGRLARDTAAMREALSSEIRAVEERLNHRIDTVREELLGEIAALDKKLTHEIYGIKQGMAVIKTLLLLIIAVQVIPLLKALSVI